MKRRVISPFESSMPATSGFVSLRQLVIDTAVVTGSTSQSARRGAGAAARVRGEVESGGHVVLAGHISGREHGVRAELSGHSGAVAVRQVGEDHTAAILHDVGGGGTAEAWLRDEARCGSRFSAMWTGEG